MTQSYRACKMAASCVNMEHFGDGWHRVKGLIEIRLKKPKKVFVVPDNIEEFDIRNYV